MNDSYVYYVQIIITGSHKWQFIENPFTKPLNYNNYRVFHSNDNSDDNNDNSYRWSKINLAL